VIEGREYWECLKERGQLYGDNQGKTRVQGVWGLGFSHVCGAWPV